MHNFNILPDKSADFHAYIYMYMHIYIHNNHLDLREVSAVKYTLNAENISDYSGVAHLDYMMPGVQVTTGSGFFLHSITKVWVKLVVLTFCLRNSGICKEL